MFNVEKHTDFNIRHGSKFLDSLTFSWNIQGYNTFSKFMPVASKIITQQANLAFTMTNRKFADKDVKLDTSDFRNAIIFYLKEIHGIRDASFKQKKINEFIGKD